MPRSATDATRFTSTTPHASAKPPPNPPSTTASPRTPGPLGETPQQKVKRLRAAADRARDAQISTFDKLIVRGRVWADRAHRFTALSLIGITFICGGVTVYALGDMMIYNRRKRAQWIEEQKGIHAAALYNAKSAIEQGRASEEEIDFVKREGEHTERIERIKKEKAEKKGIFAKAKIWMFSGLKKEEEGDDLGASERRIDYESVSEKDDGLGVRDSDVVRAIEDKKVAVENQVKRAFADEKERQRFGGPLDRIGTPATKNPASEDERPKSGGWTSFMTRK